MLGVLAERPGEITPSEPDLGNASEGKRKMCMRRFRLRLIRFLSWISVKYLRNRYERQSKILVRYSKSR